MRCSNQNQGESTVARHRKNSTDDSAQQKLHQAFWDELAETVYTRMSVSRIVARADVNRNTFYYHYDCLDDLARECVKSQLPAEIIDLVLDQAITPETLQEITATAPNMAQRLERLCAAAGPNGSGVLSDYLRQEVAALWLSKLGLAFDDLTEIEVMALKFTTAGIVSMASSLEQGNPLELLTRYIKSDFFQNTSSGMIALLKSAQARKANMSEQ